MISVCDPWSMDALKVTMAQSSPVSDCADVTQTYF